MGVWSWLFGKTQPPIVVSPAPPPTEERLVARERSGSIDWSRRSFPLEVVGESNYQNAFVAICGRHSRDGHDSEVTATIALEPTNKYDPKAVSVSVEGFKVGYIGRNQNERIGQALRDAGLESAQCSARIQGGWRTNQHDEGHFGIRLGVPARGPLTFR